MLSKIKQTNKQTNQRYQKHNHLCQEGNKHLAHFPCSLSTLLDWVESLLVGHSPFAVCIVHCSLLEPCGDPTMQSFLTMCSVHPVPKFRGIHCAKKPVTTMLTYPWKCTVLHCNHLGNTWKPLVLMLMT